MTRKRSLALILLMAFVGILVVASLTICLIHPDRPKFPFNKERTSVPFIFIWMYPKYPEPGEDVIGGLKVAVWQDGKVVRARSAAEVGKVFIQGKLKPEQLDELLRLIERVGILATKPNESSPMHVATDVLKIRTRDGSLAWAHSVPSMENALVKQIESFLMAMSLSETTTFKGDNGYSFEWEE